MELFEKLEEAARDVSAIAGKPRVGLVLGSGLGVFAERIEGARALSYEAIRHFRKVTVAGHAGKVVAGMVGGVSVVALQGRCHYYEGHPIEEVAFPVRLLCRLEVDIVVLTNAAGGINRQFVPGDLMVIRDHLNLMAATPLRGSNDERLGPRFPDMSDVYCPRAAGVFKETLTGMGLPAHEGVYAALMGPSYETPAEIRMLSALGADAVGMSTVPEAIVARHMGVRVAGISCITNMAAGLLPKKLDHREVTDTATRVRDRFIRLLETAIPRL